MKVTIGIPFFNNEETIGDAIRSIFAQTYYDWELILIDDGSTDKSLEIALSVRDTRVRVLRDGKHRGLIYRLNQIIQESKGGYIARMDADDISHPHRLEKQAAFLNGNPSVDVVGSSMYSIDKNDLPLGMRFAQSDNINTFHRISKGVFIHVSVMGRKEWFLRNKYREGFNRAEDQELWIRTYKNSAFANYPQPLVYVREESSINLAKYSESAKTMRRIFWLYAPGEVGMLLTLWLIMLSYAKVVIYCCANLLGKIPFLIHARNLCLSEEEIRLAEKGLLMVKTTPVKGLL
jgi:glycosyltransferase involved in cell wall biosynthesis